jgi:Transcriptional regulator
MRKNVMAKKKIHNPAETERLIKNSFLKLLNEKSYDEISVTEIAQAAGINRVTFYYHFENVSSLMGSIETELAEKIIRISSSLFTSDDFHDEAIERFLSLYLGSKDIFVWLFSNKTTGVGERLIYQFFRDYCVSAWKKKTGRPEPLLNCFFDSYYGQCILFLKYWYTHSADFDTDEMGQIFKDFTWNTAKYILAL